MKIFVTGTRGIPGIQGGVETHCEELYPLMVKEHQAEITILRRSSYVTEQNNVAHYKGIRIKTLYSPRSKSFEAIIHSVMAVLYAALKRPDILHIHAVGPNLVAPLARLFGLKVVMTHHGPDYERKKWGTMAKTMLKLGEWGGVKFAHRVIVISEGIGNSIRHKYRCSDYRLIPNGVPPVQKAEQYDYLHQLGVKPGQYLFTLGRFVPEKGFDYLIRAWKASSVADRYPLVIAGDADHESDYSAELRALAKANGVIMTGFIKGEPLQQLFTHARLFVLPSFYEGLPIALLEAMSYDLDILASDIAANKEVKLPEADYFETGNQTALTHQLEKKLADAGSQHQPYDMSRYNWQHIAAMTYRVYQEVVG